MTPKVSVTTKPVFIKLETENYHRKSTHHAKPHLDATTWLVLANTQFATVRVLCLSFFGFVVKHLDRTSGPILTTYASYDMFPCKDVPFGGCIDTASHLGGQFAHNPNFGGMNRHFPAKHAKYSNFHITKTTQWIPTKLCQMIKTSKYS